VIDYRSIDPKLGTWEDFREIAKSKKIMVDAVINHISRESDWFKKFLAGAPAYQDYFIQVDETWDLSNVVRPRTSPLLTEFETESGPKKVWTTFSADQIDLNYANPEVLLEVLAVLLFYLRQGATIIRLDAIAYLWKESGTTCIHLPQTHRVVKILRLVLEAASPRAVIITETNVPHVENLSYFGEVDPETGGTDEAHMVYQFPLAPLVLYTLISGRASCLMNWVDELTPAGIFFNFIASHDGIGVLPAKGILTEDELQAVVDQVHRHGGLLSHRSNPDGTRTVYELNTTLYDALNDPKAPDPAVDINRFLASQVILLSLAGVPGIYYHSLFGSRNALDEVQKTGRARSINRKKFSPDEIEETLGDPNSIHAQIFREMRHLLGIRSRQPEFDPYGRQAVFRVDQRIFGLERYSLEGDSRILILVNVSSETFDLSVDEATFGQAEEVQDLISGETFRISDGKIKFHFTPYRYLWLKIVRAK
jgi:sucrose phosphorylase